MRGRKADLCPKCGHELKVVDGSQRRVRGGRWYEVICPACITRFDRFEPVRKGA